MLQRFREERDVLLVGCSREIKSQKHRLSSSEGILGADRGRLFFRFQWRPGPVYKGNTVLERLIPMVILMTPKIITPNGPHPLTATISAGVGTLP